MTCNYAVSRYYLIQLLFLRFFRQFCWVLGAVLVISAVSATFFEIFPAVLLGFGSCFSDFSGFSYFFLRFFRQFCWVLGAVLGILAVSATFLEIFPAVSLGFGSCFVDFSGFSYFFGDFSSFWAGLGSGFRSFMDYSGIKTHSRKNDCEFFYEKNHLIDS